MTWYILKYVYIYIYNLFFNNVKIDNKILELETQTELVKRGLSSVAKEIDSLTEKQSKVSNFFVYYMS